MTLLLEDAWRLSDSVSLRPEPFGAMAYDFRTRRLSFIKSRALVAVVERLGTSSSVGAALESGGVDADQRPRYLRALEELAASGMITREPDAPCDTPATPPEQAGATA